MPATSVTDYFFEAKPRWAGTIGAGGVAAAGTTTIPLSSAAELDSGDAYIMVINRVTPTGAKNELSEMETIIGELSGTNLINCTRGVEGTAQAWAGGTVVEILITATHWNKLIAGIEVEHNADGTHASTIVKTTETQTLTNKTLTSPVLNTGVSGTAVLDDDTFATASDTTIPTSESVKEYVDTQDAAFATWVLDTDTWTYASATTFTIAGKDVTAKFPKGTKVKLTQTTDKYFYVTGSAFSTDTTITVTGGSDYTLANEAITTPYYSYAETPQGFPAYFNYSPTLTNFTVGNGSVRAIFKMSAQNVWVSIRAVLGSSGQSVGGEVQTSLPISANTTIHKDQDTLPGTVWFGDTGTTSFYGIAIYVSNNARLRVNNCASTYSVATAVSSTIPMTWSPTDVIGADFIYVAA